MIPIASHKSGESNSTSCPCYANRCHACRVAVPYTCIWNSEYGCAIYCEVSTKMQLHAGHYATKLFAEWN